MAELPVRSRPDRVIAARFELVLPGPPPPEVCPVTRFLTSDRRTKASRDASFGHLRRAALVLSDGRTDEPRRINWPALEQDDLARMVVAIEQTNAYAARETAGPTWPLAANACLQSVRGVLKQCWRLRLMSHEEYARAVDVRRAASRPLARKGRMLSVGEVTSLMKACAADPTPAGARDAAIFGVAFGCGLRRAELGRLRVDDVRPHETVSDVLVLLVHGKGDRGRKMHLTGGARDAVETWLRVRGGSPGRLFVPVNKAGRIQLDGGLAGQSLAGMMDKRALEAGVRRFSPHDCRRTFGSGEIDRHGLDVAQRRMGHADPATTVRYDHRGERVEIDAARTLGLAFFRNPAW